MRHPRAIRTRSLPCGCTSCLDVDAPFRGRLLEDSLMLVVRHGHRNRVLSPAGPDQVDRGILFWICPACPLARLPRASLNGRGRRTTRPGDLVFDRVGVQVAGMHLQLVAGWLSRRGLAHPLDARGESGRTRLHQVLKPEVLVLHEGCAKRLANFLLRDESLPAEADAPIEIARQGVELLRRRGSGGALPLRPKIVPRHPPPPEWFAPPPGPQSRHYELER